MTANATETGPKLYILKEEDKYIDRHTGEKALQYAGRLLINLLIETGKVQGYMIGIPYRTKPTVDL